MQSINLLKPFITVTIIDLIITFLAYNIWGFEVALLISVIFTTGIIVMGITGLENTLIQCHNNKK